MLALTTYVICMSKRFWEWEPAFEINPAECAFLIIDMQKGFVDAGAPLEVPMARAQAPTIAGFADFCRSHNVPVLYSRFAYNKENTYDFYYRMAPQRGLREDASGNDFDYPNPETAISDLVKPREGDVVFDKYGYDCFAFSSLGEELNKRGIKTLIIAGTVVNWCVDSTIRSAYHQKYNVVVMADGVSGCDQAGLSGDMWQTVELDHFAEAFARVLTAENLKKEMLAHLS